MNAALKIANAFRHYTRETAAKTRAMMAKEINKTPEFQNDFFITPLHSLTGISLERWWKYDPHGESHTDPQGESRAGTRKTCRRSA